MAGAVREAGHTVDVYEALFATDLAAELAGKLDSLKPIGVDDEFCRLLADSGCGDLNLAIESASETMLRSMKRGYTVRQVRESLELGITRPGGNVATDYTGWHGWLDARVEPCSETS